MARSREFVQLACNMVAIGLTLTSVTRSSVQRNWLLGTDLPSKRPVLPRPRTVVVTLVEFHPIDPTIPSPDDLVLGQLPLCDILAPTTPCPHEPVRLHRSSALRNPPTIGRGVL